MMSRTQALAAGLLVLALIGVAGCPEMTGTEADSGGTTTDGGDGSGENGGTTTDQGTASGTWNATDGLVLSSNSATLTVGADDQPSTNDLTMEVLTEDDLVAAGLTADSGFEVGVTLGPDGTTFDQAVDVTVQLSEATPLNTLQVLTQDETSGEWVDAGLLATVSEDGTSATFQLTSFSTYVPWDPPLPTDAYPIGGAGIVAGTGGFSGMPFDPLPGTTTSSLTYSPYGDVFGLSLINAGAQTGAAVTSSAGLHATSVSESGNVAIGYVTPGGGLSGPSLFNDGNFNHAVGGVMFLAVDEQGNWSVSVYCAYDEGVIIGVASGE